MAIKKYTNGSWVSASYRKYGTETDTITTLPATVIGDGTPISSYTIKGNMEQIGTPTPENPIMPSGCGDLVASGEHAGQYKLPLTLGNTTTNIYLGEVETTRRVKKLVLTGSEDYTWYKSATQNYSWYIFPNTIGTIANTPFYCSHGETVTNVLDYGYGKVYCDNTCNLGIFDSSINSLTKLNNYFAQQYANGTPVTIWYVLATEETGIVNEPLMKIGDYVDSVSGTGLATSGTTQELDVDTTLKPSAVDLTYHGWHEHEDTEFTT